MENISRGFVSWTSWMSGRVIRLLLLVRWVISQVQHFEWVYPSKLSRKGHKLHRRALASCAPDIQFQIPQYFHVSCENSLMLMSLWVRPDVTSLSKLRSCASSGRNPKDTWRCSLWKRFTVVFSRCLVQGWELLNDDVKMLVLSIHFNIFHFFLQATTVNGPCCIFPMMNCFFKETAFSFLVEMGWDSSPRLWLHILLSVRVCSLQPSGFFKARTTQRNSRSCTQIYWQRKPLTLVLIENTAETWWSV